MKYGLMRHNDLFEDMFDNVFKAPVMSPNALMKTDVHEKDGKYILDVEIPGYKKEDVQISLYNGTLSITASKNNNTEEKDDSGRVIRQERYSGTCSRSFYVGEGVKDTDVHATFTDGILKIELPTEQKKEEAEKKYIDIL